MKAEGSRLERGETSSSIHITRMIAAAKVRYRKRVVKWAGKRVNLVRKKRVRMELEIDRLGQMKGIGYC